METVNAGSYKVMGIINLTDNSFVSESRLVGAGCDQIVARVERMLDEGADIIDVGACSSAPGNALVDEETEWKRLKEPLTALFGAFPDIVFSIDTFRSGIVKKILPLRDNFIVNDIFCGRDDKALLPLAAEEGLGYIAMDSSDDPLHFFESFAERAENEGLRQWILDPGFGFGKSLEQNLNILENLEAFKRFGRPVLAGMSRKRMIYLPLNLTASTCSEASVAAELKAVGKGADIIRTHDVAAHKSRVVRQASR